MKKLFALLLAAMSLTMMATGPDTLTFRQNDNTEISGILGVLNACQITADVHDDSISAKYYELSAVTVIDGHETRERLGIINTSPDSTSICITVMATDSASAMVYVMPHSTTRKKISVPTDNCLLIDCCHDEGYERGDTITLMAYSPGIRRKFDLGDGKVVDAFDICGLRYSQVHPSEWHERFKIPSYVYFEAIPVNKIAF